MRWAIDTQGKHGLKKRFLHTLLFRQLSLLLMFVLGRGKYANIDFLFRLYKFFFLFTDREGSIYAGEINGSKGCFIYLFITFSVASQAHRVPQKYWNKLLWGIVNIDRNHIYLGYPSRESLI